MNYLRKPRELVTPQFRALGGVQRLPYEAYIEAMAQRAPEIKEQERIRKQEEEYIRLAEEEREAGRRAGKTGLAIAGTEVALRAKPYLAKFMEAGKATGADSVVMGDTLATSLLKGKGGTFGAKTLGATAKYLAPAAFGATAGSLYSGFAEEHDWGRKMQRKVGGGKEEWDVAGGAVTGALTGAATGLLTSGFNPVGALVGALGGAAGAKCIIVTACTNPDSYEVNIAREYRDKFMDKIDLRGYYWLAERAVNTIKKHSVITCITKHILVDKLIDYGEWKLGKKEQKPRLLSTLITKLFLKLCRIAGRIIPTVLRGNGEVF